MDIGANLRRLRISHNLTQEELADRAELSKGFISQVERNLTSPSIATLIDLLQCLGSSLSSFFTETADEKIVFTRDDLFIKEDDDVLKGEITWLVPNAQKNKLEPIMVNLKPQGRTQEIPPHEGEEFGYVYSGTVYLVVGAKRYKVSAGESFCLHPSEPHYICNQSKRRANFIWVSTPPSF
ncbi:MAG: cupin domain-containing protein [Clostridiales bacterium]|nr:cupin domain-containing protein [Clostridiales bacterium]